MRQLPLRSAAAVVVALTVGSALVATASTGASAGGRKPVERVLVFSMPAIGWEDLDRSDLPNLARLVDESAVADLSVRTVTRHTSASDGYITLGAGTRAKGSAGTRLAFEVGDEYDGVPAEAEFARRTGTEPTGSEIFNFGIVTAQAVNGSLDYGAEIGALGDALDDAGVPRAVVGSADHPVNGTEIDYQRQATGALMGSDGIVPDGSIDPTLLQEDPTAPYGVRYDTEHLVGAFAEPWARGGVVLVEAGDLARWDSFRHLTQPAQADRMRDQALRFTDELVGALLERVDPASDAVVLVGPYHRSGDAHVTIAALRAPGVEPGLLRSGTTRRSGFVSIVDVAPTILDLVGVDRPDSMEGRPFERGATGGDAGQRRAFLIDAASGALFRDAQVPPVTVWYVLLQAMLWGFAVLAMGWGSARSRHLVELLALATLGFAPATFIASALPFHELGPAAFWAFVLVVSAVFGLVTYAVGRRHVADSLIVGLSATILLLALDVFTGATLQLNAVFGYSPTIAGRFAGFGNLAFGMLAGTSLLLAGLLADRIGGRRGVWVAVGMLSAVIVLDGAPFWGSDVGGVLALVPAAGVTAWLLWGRRVRVRTVAAWGAVGVVIVMVFGMIDLTRPEDSRTHLGRLFEAIGNQGFDAFETVVLRKLEANLTVLTSSVWTLMVPVVFGFLGYLFWKAPGALRRVGDELPAERASLVGLLIVMFLGFALNDSGIAVPGLILGVVNASLVFLVLRVNESADSRDQGEPSATVEHPPPAARPVVEVS